MHIRLVLICMLGSSTHILYCCRLRAFHKDDLLSNNFISLFPLSGFSAFLGAYILKELYRKLRFQGL